MAGRLYSRRPGRYIGGTGETRVGRSREDEKLLVYTLVSLARMGHNRDVTSRSGEIYDISMMALALAFSKEEAESK